MAVERPGADRIHIAVRGGQFVPHIGLGLRVISGI